MQVLRKDPMAHMLRLKQIMKLHSNKHQVVVITGASAGVGRATVREFAKRRAKIALIARGPDGLEATRREVELLGGEALVIPLDVADATAIEQAATLVEEKLGPIDIWVNNAMASVFSPVSLMTPEDYKRVTDVTYLGYVWGTLAALKCMKKRNRGVIVQVGSALAHRSIPLQSAYCAAKHAVMGFNESLRCELLHEKSKVQVTIVQLPAVNTPQFSWVKSRLPYQPQPVPPIYQPEVPARAIYWAAQHPRRELFVTPSTFKAIEGEKFAPNYADHYLAKHGYSSQQTNTPTSPNRRDNLWRPLSGDHGAHGSFDTRARKHSLQLFLSLNRSWLYAAAVSASIIFAAKKLKSNKKFSGRHSEWQHKPLQMF